jgi:1,4-dihydroxy-2-naphthoyl-CoA hydrolase
MPAKNVTIEILNDRSKGHLPGLIGLQVTALSPGKLTSVLKIRDELLAPNGYLHAASVVALADTSCGYGSVANLPVGATGFTTIELKSNFLGTARSGSITCVATLTHGGKGTQVWDAVVTNDATDKVICLFRCTQMILYPLVNKRK